MASLQSPLNHLAVSHCSSVRPTDSYSSASPAAPLTGSAFSSPVLGSRSCAVPQPISRACRIMLAAATEGLQQSRGDSLVAKVGGESHSMPSSDAPQHATSASHQATAAPSPFTSLFTAAAVPFHVLAVALPVAVSVLFFNGSRFGYHPPFLAIAYMFFMAESIYVAIQAKGKARTTLLYVHAALQSLSLISILIGMYAIVSNKNLAGKPHLVSLHARIGAAALLLGAFVALGGGPLLWGFPEGMKKKLTPVVSKAHKMGGSWVYVIGTAAVISGLQTFKPSHPLHKGLPTYVLTFGALVLALLTFSSSFAAKELSKAVLPKQKKIQ